MKKLPSKIEYGSELARRFGDSEFFEFARRWGPKQREILESERYFTFLFGGNGAGKTKVGSYWAAMGPIGYNPITGEFFRRDRKRPFNTCVIGQTLADVDLRLRPAMEEWIPRSEYRTREKSNHFEARDGTWNVYFKSVDQGQRRHQGYEYDRVWIDEEPTDPDVWTEVNARTFRRLGQTLVTLTATAGTNWLHAWIYSRDRCPTEWKRVIEMPTDENPYYYDCDHCGHPKVEHSILDPGCEFPSCECAGFNNKQGLLKIERARRQYHGIEYEIRFLGKFILRAGAQVIAHEVLSRQERIASQSKIAIGYIDDSTRFVPMQDPEDPRVWCRISMAPIQGREYVMGVDSGGGNPLGDWHAAVVFDTLTGDQVASAHTRSFTPLDWAGLVCRLGRFYNDAFAVPETNIHGHAVVERMVQLGYGAIYRRRIIDDRASGLSSKLGWYADSKTKPTAVNLMVALFANVWRIRDQEILDEAYHFTWLKQKREGTHGIGSSNPDAHDDLMAACYTAAEGWRSLGLLVDAADEEKIPPPPHRTTIQEEIDRDLKKRGPVTEEEIAALEAESYGRNSFARALAQDLGIEESENWGE